MGRGKLASVYKARRTSDGLLVAIKTVEIFDISPEERNQCLNEAVLATTVSHANLIQCIEVFLEGNNLHMVSEFAAGGDMSHLIADMKAKGQLLRIRLPTISLAAGMMVFSKMHALLDSPPEDPLLNP